MMFTVNYPSGAAPTIAPIYGIMLEPWLARLSKLQLIWRRQQRLLSWEHSRLVTVPNNNSGFISHSFCKETQTRRSVLSISVWDERWTNVHVPFSRLSYILSLDHYKNEEGVFAYNFNASNHSVFLQVYPNQTWAPLMGGVHTWLYYCFRPP